MHFVARTRFVRERILRLRTAVFRQVPPDDLTIFVPARVRGRRVVVGEVALVRQQDFRELARAVIAQLVIQAVAGDGNSAQQRGGAERFAVERRIQRLARQIGEAVTLPGADRVGDGGQVRRRVRVVREVVGPVGSRIRVLRTDILDLRDAGAGVGPVPSRPAFVADQNLVLCAAESYAQ
jgi:hypothetical protein